MSALAPVIVHTAVVSCELREPTPVLLLDSLRVCGDANQGMLTCWQFLEAGTQILGVCPEQHVQKGAALCKAVSWAVDCNLVLMDLL